MNIDAENRTSGLPLIEILKTNIVDKKTNERIEGIVGNNFLLMYVTMTLVCCC